MDERESRTRQIWLNTLHGERDLNRDLKGDGKGYSCRYLERGECSTQREQPVRRLKGENVFGCVQRLARR